MKLYIGGIYQGQAELARKENPDAELFADYHETIRSLLSAEFDPRAYALDFCQAHPNAVVVANEVGAGVVPIDREERSWREAVGRALCVIAAHSEQVTRVICGIGVRIK